MNFEPLIKARKLLDTFWKSSLLKGRCWGPIRRDNPFSGSNIIMSDGESLVSVSQLPDGSLRIHEFCKTIGGTLFGAEVRKTLGEAGISIQD